MFNVHTGRKYDRQNQFQELRQVVRRKSDSLCRGAGAGAQSRREDMIKILTEAVMILKAESEVHAPTKVKTEVVTK